ncbi:MerR family transcriptional regulator [Amycolatopsis aidingensis]|uniref:MerR family transcriptional regulator n=1 Tax=Amycolatopsis aidingensis TaxID=2842453 RepID=UPI001C0C959C|nr:MerR family transcriptional regulator [Amycolatopsis aidingensis]
MSYSIAEAARRSGLSIDTLRYYERINLLEPPARDAAGRRAYSDTDLTWLEFLTKLRTTGMPIRRMREYASLRKHGTASAGRRKAILVEQRSAVAARIAELQACMEVLDYKISNYEQIECAMADVAAQEAETRGVPA